MAEQKRKTDIVKGKGEAQKALESAFATSFRVLKFLMYAVVIWLLFSGVFQVQQNQKAIVLRFGKLKAVYGPGFHFALPYPIDSVEKVNVEELKTIEIDKTFWHREITAGNPPMPLIPSLENGYTLTSDANIIHSKWVLRYKINDPVKYLLDIGKPDALLLNILNNAIIEGSSQFTVDEATRNNIQDFRQVVERVFLKKLHIAGHADTFAVQAVNISAVKPPLQTEEAFAAVINAEQERDRKLSDARGEANRIRNEAGGAVAQLLVEAIDKYIGFYKSGETDKALEAQKEVNALLEQSGGAASKIISEAEAYRKMVVTEASSDAVRITELSKQYKENPKILLTEKLFELYTEILKDKVLYVFKESSAKGGSELRLQINPDPEIEREERQKAFKEEVTQPK